MDKNVTFPLCAFHADLSEQLKVAAGHAAATEESDSSYDAERERSFFVRPVTEAT